MSTMNEILKQSKEFFPANHPKITGSKTTIDRTYSLRPPFGIDDHLQILARFKASRQNAVAIVNPSFRKRRIPRREFEVNPNMKTMYQYQYNDTADEMLGYCDNRSIESLNEYFKRCQQNAKNMLELHKLGMPELPPRKYRSDYNKRVSEYTAEIGYVASKFVSYKIHDHSKCGRLPRKCVHYIEF